MDFKFLNKFSQYFAIFNQASELVGSARNLLTGKTNDLHGVVNEDKASDVDNEINFSHLSEIKKAGAHMLKDLKEIMSEITDMLNIGDDEDEEQSEKTKKELLELGTASDSTE